MHIYYIYYIYYRFYILNIYRRIYEGFLGVGVGSCIRNDTRDFTGLETGLVVVACGPSSKRIGKLELMSIACVCQVTVSVNGGKGETSASFIPEEPLCDGRWHSISGEFCPQTHAPCTTLSSYRSNAEMSLQW